MIIGRQAILHQKRMTALFRLLPDTCKIFIPYRPVDSGFYSEEIANYITYNGSTDIPCRFDVARFYRSGDIQGLEVVISDFELSLPYDLQSFTAECRIYFNGEYYEVRKLMTAFSHMITQTAIVARLDKPSISGLP